MIKSLTLVSIAFLLCNCASQQPNSEAAGLTSNQGVGQQTVTITGSNSELAQTQSTQPAIDRSSPSENDNESVPAEDSSELNSAMEVVEVEGIKEKHCTVERQTGSRIPKKYCRTVREDEMQREAGQSWINTLKTRPQGNPNGRG